jgi:ABC-type phosphate transport system ATPase subunit
MNMDQTQEQTNNAPILSVSDLNLHYGDAQALKGINLDMARHQVSTG